MNGNRLKTKIIGKLLQDYGYKKCIINHLHQGANSFLVYFFSSTDNVALKVLPLWYHFIPIRQDFANSYYLSIKITDCKNLMKNGKSWTVLTVQYEEETETNELVDEDVAYTTQTLIV